MQARHEEKMPLRVKVTAGIVVVLLVVFGTAVVKIILSQGDMKKRTVHSVTLLKPPPPPKVVEKPPEPEVKEQIKEPEPIEQPDTDSSDEPPPGENLGLDADGSAGSDAFGLLGKKGGRSLVGSDDGGTLMKKYGWYIRSIEDVISKELVRKGKIPQGGLQLFVLIVLDERGNIVNHRIYASSGSDLMDRAVDDALRIIGRIHEPPPEGMPRTLKIKITSPA